MCMKLKLSSLLIAGLFTLTASVAHAYDGCKNPSTEYDRTYCTAKLFLESDKELNDTYSGLMKYVKGDVKKSLIQVQKQWINYRNDKCSVSGTIDVDCNFNVNKARTVFLNDRLRECKTGHCQNDLITSDKFKETT